MSQSTSGPPDGFLSEIYEAITNPESIAEFLFSGVLSIIFIISSAVVAIALVAGSINFIINLFA